MGIKKIKTRSQRITSFGYLKKIQNQRTAADSGYFKKTSQNCRVSRKPRKEEPSRFLGGYFTFTIWDLGFRTSIYRLIEKIARCFTDLSFPPPPKTSVTDRETYWINIYDDVVTLSCMYFVHRIWWCETPYTLCHVHCS